MSESDPPELWNRSLTRRSVLHTGGLGLAAGALATFGRVQGAAGAQSRDPERSGLRTGMAHEELSVEERIDRAIAQIDDIVADIMERSGIPGLAVSITHADRAALARGYGVRDSRSNDPVDADTVFHLASVSKPFASTVVAALVGDGIVDWDSRIADLIPEFQMYDPWVTREVTIRDMMTHRSGLPGHAGDLLEDIGYERDEILRRLRYLKPGYSLRDGYAYTNFGFTAGAVAAARAAGTSWEEASTQRLYDRLGLSRTSSSFAEFSARTNRANPHVEVEDEWRPVHVRQPDAQSPAGGVTSSASDMARWLQLHLGNGTINGDEIIAPDALAESHQPQVINQPPADPATDLAGFYGIGWNVSYDGAGRIRLGHSGAFELGAATSVSIIPALDLGISVLTNAAPIGAPEAIIASFIDLIDSGDVQHDYLELIGEAFAVALAPPYASDYDDPPADASDPLDDAVYTGVYHNSFYGRAEIAEGTRGLVLRLGPNQMEHELTHYDRDMFLYQPVGENAYGPSPVRFSISPDGSAGSMDIDILAQYGDGRFHRNDLDS